MLGARASEGAGPGCREPPGGQLSPRLRLSAERGLSSVSQETRSLVLSGLPSVPKTHSSPSFLPQMLGQVGSSLCARCSQQQLRGVWRAEHPRGSLLHDRESGAQVWACVSPVLLGTVSMQVLVGFINWPVVSAHFSVSNGHSSSWAPRAVIWASASVRGFCRNRVQGDIASHVPCSGIWARGPQRLLT